MRNVWLAATLALIAAATPAGAQTTIVDGGTRGLSFLRGGEQSPIGQSFTATGTGLTSFGFELATVSTAATNAALTLTLRRGAGLTGEVVAVREVTPVATAGRTPFWQDFAFGGTTLVENSVYTAVLSATTGRLAVRYGPTLPGGGVDPYAGGSLFGTPTVSTEYCAANACDANFRFTVTNVAAAVPEPASWALMIVGFGTVGARLRRRRAPALAAA